MNKFKNFKYNLKFRINSKSKEVTSKSKLKQRDGNKKETKLKN